jgi:DNA polymerase III alpha subunit
MQKLSTDLDERTLRFDGVSILSPELIARALVRGVPPSMLRVREVSPEIESFNAQVAEQDRIRLDAPEPVALDMEWRLPENYRMLNLENRIVGTFMSRSDEFLKKYGVEKYDEAVLRIQAEYEQIEQRGMVEFMRTIIYVLDTFREKGIVWGVGRGSSCACYILFVLGLHAVDCVLHEIPLEEFFHD